MTKYNNIRKDAALASVEFAPQQGAHYAFFTLNDAGSEGKIRQALQSSPKPVEIIAQTQQGGQQVLIARTANTPEEMLANISANGDSFVVETPKKAFQGWKWRGILSLSGQGLDILSVFLATKKGTRSSGDNAAYLVFAIFNIAASLINITFGAKKMPDTYRAQALKSQINDVVKPYIAEGQSLPSPEVNLSTALVQEQPKSTWEKAREYIRSHSVYIDMALRSFGNLNLILPVTKWNQPGWKNKINDNPYTRAAGISLFAGKAVTAFSKVPDPYNPKPSSALDKAREKVFFKFGNTVESLSAVLMGYNSFAGTKDASGVRKNNPASGFANVLFMFGYGARFFAPFGVRELNLPEIEAHVAECLAKVPQDKLPQLIADVSAKLKDDLKDQPIELGQIYTHIMSNLAKRQIALPQTPTRAAEQEQQKTPLASERLKRTPPAPKLHHTDLAEKSATPLGIS